MFCFRQDTGMEIKTARAPWNVPKVKHCKSYLLSQRNRRKIRTMKMILMLTFANTDSDPEVNDDVLDPTDYMDDADDESVDTEL